MRVLRRLSPFHFSLTLGVLVVLVPMYATAWCCGCGMCYMKNYTSPPCVCNGTPPCASCLLDGSDPSQDNAPINNGAADINSMPGGLTSVIATLDITERLTELMSGGKCFRDKVALNLLANARDELKFVPMHFDENNTLAFLMNADQEK